MGLIAISLLGLISTSLTGCAGPHKDPIINLVKPYRINIVQGNVVSKETVAKLRVGLTMDQVRLLLGTPLLTDLFHKDRWDYVFYFKRGADSQVQQRTVTVFFKDNLLTSWEGADNLPSEEELIQEIDGQRRDQKSKSPSADKKTGS